ncbi:hypothetical protein GCM10008905_32240 [Clostridium malenominatum]|uniref:Stage II sporulation protein P n=1 Tax=Clostridium malenominatum TaxID=1539 RepID=A0ABN1J7U4_9CLOT
MNTMKKKIIIALTFVTLCCTALGFSYSELKKKTAPSNDAVNLSVEDKVSQTPIVIYNTHVDEEYNFGKNVIDVGKIISNNLKKEGLNSNFIEVSPPSSYLESYPNSRETIKNKASNYDKSVLLDIHRQVSNDSKTNNRSILLVLSKNSPNYESNKSFADSLMKEINEIGKVKADIYLFNKGINYFNQDLAKNSLIVEIGSEKSTAEDVNACISTLVSALKKVNISSF